MTRGESWRYSVYGLRFRKSLLRRIRGWLEFIQGVFRVKCCFPGYGVGMHRGSKWRRTHYSSFNGWYCVCTLIIVDRLDSSDLRKQDLEARFQENRFTAKQRGCSLMVVRERSPAYFG
jgi:hypothetical protein